MTMPAHHKVIPIPFGLIPVALFLVLPGQALADTLTGRVVGVHDGDTLTLLAPGNVQYKIRLHGIDAPELGQPFGQRSKANLSGLAYRKHAEANCPKVDKYRRKVCQVVVNGRDVGLAQLEAGLAWWFRRYAAEQAPRERDIYESFETRARVDGIGLWQDRSPVPPWDFRRQWR